MPKMHCFSGPWCAEVEDRLAVVIAQEEEVRAIADDHLEREGYLIKLLQDLYGQQKVGCNLPWTGMTCETTACQRL